MESISTFKGKWLPIKSYVCYHVQTQNASKHVLNVRTARDLEKCVRVCV